MNKIRIPYFAFCSVIVVFAMFFMFSCGPKSRKGDVLVASVGDKRLYLSEMNGIFPKEGTKEDSLALARLFIDNWVKTMLLLNKAELNLTSEELNIVREIETYRASLLIYKYEERMLQEKLDTMVYDFEIRRYYEANTASFSISDYAVRAAFIKLPRNAPELWNVRRLISSVRENDIQILIDYCRRYAVRYDFFDDEWIYWANVEMEFPQQEAATRQMRFSTRIEQEDDDFIYLVHIRERRAPGETAPLVFVRDRIKSIIINQRKLQFISELHRDIYNDALARRQFNVY